MSEPVTSLLSSPAFVTALVGIGTSIGALASAVRYYAGRVKEAESTKRSNLSEYVRRSDQQWQEWKEQDAREKKELKDRIDELLKAPRILASGSTSNGNHPKEE